MLHFNFIDRLWHFGGLYTRNKLDEAEKGIYGSNGSNGEMLTATNSIVCLNQLDIGISGTFKAIILGRRASGRTSLVKQLVKSGKNSCNLIFNGIENLTPTYGVDNEISSVSEIHAQYYGKVLQQFLTNNGANFGKKVITVVFDNCFDMGSSKDGCLEMLMTLPVNVIFVVDHPMTLPLQIKTKCNFLFLFKENVYITRKRIYDNWKLQSMFPSMEVYDKMYASATDVQYGYLLVDMARGTCYVGRALSSVNIANQSLTRCKSSHNVSTELETIPEEMDVTDMMAE